MLNQFLRRLIICNDRYDFRNCLLLFMRNPPTNIAGPEDAMAVFHFCVDRHSLTTANELLKMFPSSVCHAGDGLVKARIWHVSYRSTWEQEPRGKIIKSFLHLLILLDGLLSTFKGKGQRGCHSSASTLLTPEGAMWSLGVGVGGFSCYGTFQGFYTKKETKICHFSSALFDSIEHFTPSSQSYSHHNGFLHENCVL